MYWLRPWIKNCWRCSKKLFSLGTKIEFPYLNLKIDACGMRAYRCCLRSSITVLLLILFLDLSLLVFFSFRPSKVHRFISRNANETLVISHWGLSFFKSDVPRTTSPRLFFRSVACSLSKTSTTTSLYTLSDSIPSSHRDRFIPQHMPTSW